MPASETVPAPAVQYFTVDADSDGQRLGIVIVNACISISQEDNAEKALEALQKMSAPLAKVTRGGQLLRLVGDDLPAEFEPAAGIGLEEVYLYYCAGNKAINT